MEPLVHILLPALILLAFLPKYKKEVLLFSLFAILPDFDTYIPFYHRTIFHNIFFILASVIIVYILLNKFKAILAGYYLLSHLILDIGYPGAAFLYPLYKKFIAFSIAITTEASKGIYNLKFKFDIITNPVSSNIASIGEGTYFGVISLMVLVVFIMGTLIYLIKKEGKL